MSCNYPLPRCEEKPNGATWAKPLVGLCPVCQREGNEVKTSAAIRNLGTYYFAGIGSNYDWTTPQNDRLWQDGTKTLFDPCPSGWRVPKSGAGELSPWNTFGTDPYAAPFYFYINGVKQTAPGTPVFAVYPSNGRLYEADDIKTWYPTPSFRDAGNYSKFGGLDGAGNYGYSWSSSINGINGRYLGFNYTWLAPSGATYRAHGLPVRCLRE